MNAFLFAAGNGMRLRPITQDFQKCLLPVRGKPILEWWLNAVFDSKKFEHVFVNVHHMADQVETWLDRYSRRTGRKIERIDERAGLLGTARTLFYYGGMDDFMAAYTDTFCLDAYARLGWYAEVFQNQSPKILAGLLTFDAPKDGSTGNIRVDSQRIVIDFKEKSKSGIMAWAGILFGRRTFLDELGPKDKDLASDVFPRLCEKMKCIGHIEAYDIGRGVKQYESISKI